jgi:thioredoxin reductase (NADPH)
MLAALEALRGEHEFSVEVMDVDANPDWVVRYDQLVPVLVLGNEEICHYFLNTAKVREVLSRFR